MLGLNAIFLTNCRKPWLLMVNPDTRWYMYTSPGVILVLYYMLAFETRSWIKRVRDFIPTTF